MPYRIEAVDLYVRELPPDRMAFAIGAAPVKRRPRGILLARLKISDGEGKKSWGVSGDRPSFGWLDKRDQYDPETKLKRLLDLVKAARKVYLESGNFSSPFPHWRSCYAKIQDLGRKENHEALTSGFASALFERAMIDAVCRLHQRPILGALKSGLLGFEAGQVFPELQSVKLKVLLPNRPLFEHQIRHTVGLKDPLTDADLSPKERINDGEPETLAEYIQRDGLRYFKVKIAGDRKRDLERLGRIWQVLQKAPEPVVTLDGNESYRDLGEFSRFVIDLEENHLGLFQHIAFIEQPLGRDATLDPATKEAIQELSKKKDLVIDEADGEPGAFRRAFELGYAGVSHKNCKGFFKSLFNYCLCRHFAERSGRSAFQTGEDLSNMPLVPLQQDFAALGVLGISDCERNGHHYSLGLEHLSPQEKHLALKHHGDLYTKRNGELFLNIQNGRVRTASLARTPFGIAFEPNWQAMTPLDDWTVKW